MVTITSWVFSLARLFSSPFTSDLLADISIAMLNYENKHSTPLLCFVVHKLWLNTHEKPSFHGLSKPLLALLSSETSSMADQKSVNINRIVLTIWEHFTQRNCVFHIKFLSCWLVLRLNIWGLSNMAASIGLAFLRTKHVQHTNKLEFKRPILLGNW